MRILHTSDWHLGAYLQDESRLPEQVKFLDWLKGVLREEKPDALVVAGDVFDTCAPSNQALELYYQFLAVLFAEKLCGMTVVIGGNHDSPSLLDAPSGLLSHLRTRVVGAVEYIEGEGGERVAQVGREVVLVPDAEGRPGLAIGAIPYLRDADLRRSSALESDAEQTGKLKEGFREHTRTVADLARKMAGEAGGKRVPLVLMGHLYVTGASLAEEPSERSLNVGGLGGLEAELLPKADYVALGHLHVPQAVKNAECGRYSGSPIPLSFGEANQKKSVVVVDFEGGKAPGVRLREVPRFQELEQVKGTMEAVEGRLKELVAAKKDIWVDARITEGEGDLRPFWNQVEAMVKGSRVRLMREHDQRPGKETSGLAGVVEEGVSLKEMKPAAVFAMRLGKEHLKEEELQMYGSMFEDVCRGLAEADINKE